MSRRPPRRAVSIVSLPTVLAVLVAGLAVEATSAAPAEASERADVPPATIRVCRDRYGGGATEDVPFKDYVRTVLASEFPSSWPVATLRAGAVAVRSYAWWHVLHPYSSRCALTDSTRHQKYDPNDRWNPPTAKTNAAVDATWGTRLVDRSTGTIAYAQYCSGSACNRFPPGKHINQWDAKAEGDAGWSYQRILEHAYRNMPPQLDDWRAGFAFTLDGTSPYALSDSLQVKATARGVPPGDPRASADLYAVCTMDGTHAIQHVASAPVADDGGAARATFDQTGPIGRCTEDEIPVAAVLRVNGYAVGSGEGQVWRPWVSASSREVQRIADTDRPVDGTVRISQRLFADAGATIDAPPALSVPSPNAEPTPAPSVTSAADTTPTLADAADVVADPAPAPTADATDPAATGTAADQRDVRGRRAARAVVLARSDAFPDALSATGLAGPDAPILLTPGGPDAHLDPTVRQEIDRLLDAGGLVHVVGGPNAISDAVVTELRDAGYRVSRHGGTTRIETALAVADAVRADGGDMSTALVARAYPDSSAGWADAVTAGAYAASLRHPMLLTAPDRLDPRTESYLEDASHGVEEVVLLGGPSAIAADAEQRLAPMRVDRVAGKSRDDTAVAVVDELWSRGDAPDVQRALIIDGFGNGDWPFALAASVYAANLGAPELVVTTLVPRSTTGRWLDGQEGLPVVVVGGDGVVRPRIDRDVSGSQ